MLMATIFRSRFWQSLVLPCLLLTSVHAFYMPGWSIKTYEENEAIPLLVNKITSENSQLQFSYYSLPFVCPPLGKKHAGSSLLSGQPIPLNLGEVLRGDRIQQSDIELLMGKDYECKFLCNRTVTAPDLKRARQLVKEGYVVEWIVDKLPGATSYMTVDKSRKYYIPGFKLGYVDLVPNSGKKVYYLNNHVTIVIKYRKASGLDGERGKRVIVGFEVYTKSVGSANRKVDGCPLDIENPSSFFELGLTPNSTDDMITKYPLSSYHPPESESEISNDDGRTVNIPYTYSVYWRENDQIEWGHRWDMYFVNSDAENKIHWLAIINSLIISGLMSAIVAMILARTIRADINSGGSFSPENGKGRRSKWKITNYLSSDSHDEKGGLLDQIVDDGNDADVSSDEEPLEDQSGWKLLAGDIFRVPAYGSLLTYLIGSGMQLLFMALGLLLLSSFGVLNPSLRGSFISAGVGLFIFAGGFSGYFSGRLYKTFGGIDWRRNAFLTAILFPGFLLAFFFTLNLFVWTQASSTALPFGTLIFIIVLWLCIQLPLVYIGSWYGYTKSGAWNHPTKFTLNPRPIPPQHWYMKNLQSILFAGFAPFFVIFLELTYVFQSLWQDKSGSYYLFGFLLAVSAIFIITIIEVTVVCVYLKLCSEDHHWWWYSFAVGGGNSIWVFAYCVYYYFTKIHIEGFVSGLLFFSYSAIACIVHGLLCGTIGFLTGYTFVRRIYAAIKAD
ncbi:Transmembrane 9 superfamily member 4 [Golovinomyces cichoracearum]|uniref:Transmembrane 9 superfamily member n=1 Tax=Golovinomyces cichoracearum TaxID=62708 RepID=A0A420J8V5_9PEZI|nr:Transmembrane 9 superfamily member 4 [Golovinomyces cichoracearum]